MEKKSSKTNKNEGNDELIIVNINGEEFLTLSLGRIIKTIETFVKRVQIGNYSNDNPNLSVEEAIARFEIAYTRIRGYMGERDAAVPPGR